MFIAFVQPELQSTIDWSLPTSAHQRKAPGTNGSVSIFFLLIPDMFYQEALPKFQHKSRVNSLLTIGADRHWWKVAATFENSQISKFTSVCMERVPFLVWVLINAMWLLQSKWVPIFMGAYFVWELVIPNIIVQSLRWAVCQTLLSGENLPT